MRDGSAWPNFAGWYPLDYQLSQTPRLDRIDAPCVFDGPINGRKFPTYVERFLVPTLRPGDIVVLDNLGSHKGKAVRRVIRDAGAHRLFLPPYSPDLNPIEQAFAKLKHWPRHAQPRSIDDIHTPLSPPGM